MNEIFKQNTARKVLAAMEGYKNRTGKNITALDLCHRLGIKHVSYITKIKRKEWHKNVPTSAWEAFRAFVNSGSRLEDYNVHTNPPSATVVLHEINEYSDSEVKLPQKKGGIIPGQKTQDINLPDEKIISTKAIKEPGPFIKEIIKEGTPLNKKVLALIDGEPGQDPVCKLCFEVDFKITINGRPI